MRSGISGMREFAIAMAVKYGGYSREEAEAAWERAEALPLETLKTSTDTIREIYRACYPPKEL